MDHAKRGSEALDAGRFADAIKEYSDAIKLSPTSPDYHIKRSTAFQRSSPPDFTSALQDAEKAVVFAEQRAKRELIAKAQLRRAIALFGLERYADCKFVLDIVEELDPKEKTQAVWRTKTDNKIKTLPEDHPGLRATVPKTPVLQGEHDTEVRETTKRLDTTAIDSSIASQPPAPAQTPKEKIKHDWYQQDDKVVVTLLVKGAPKDKVVVEINELALSINFPLVTGAIFDLDLDLYARVDPSLSTFQVLATKIEVSLRKAQPGQKWRTLETQESTQPAPVAISTAQKPTASASTGPLYPSSSKTGPKNWDKLADELTAKKPQKDGDAKDGKATADDDDYDYEAEEGDAANAFFKKLYKGANDDVRRAMMKSFQESNGTALSTNWEEVKKGPVATQPPDGVEAKPWK